MSNNVFIDLSEELHNKGWTVHWEFNSDIDPALLKYNNCVTYLDCREINPDVATDVDEENGAWNYRLDNLETGGVFDLESGTIDGLFMIDTSTPNSELVSFNVDLPNLTDGSGMFVMCQSLTSFSGKLPSLTNGHAMFSDTTLQSFSSDMSSLTDGRHMFSGCKNLTSFSSDLRNLADGSYMFYFCTNLTSFSGDLSSLTDGTYMFGPTTSTCTKLDLASVQNIADTINTVSSGNINIGISSSIRSDADLETALAAIRAKGWTVSELYA